MAKQKNVIPNKVALVTGSGKRRIGWHVADALAKRGYALALHYRSSAAEANEAVAAFQAQGVHAVALQADLTDEKAVHNLIRETLSHSGRLDVLVNCAADWKSKKLEDVTAADVRHYFETNMLSTFLCCQQAGLAMVQQQEGGNIITLGDWATHRPYLDYAAYFPSKGAIPTLTRTLAVELGTRNPAVRVNCILPGPVMLPPDLPAAEKEQAIAATLVKREGRPENIAQAVLFFLDNDFVTGVCLPVDGGRSIYQPWSRKRWDIWLLPFRHVLDRFFQVIRIVDPFRAAVLRPPFVRRIRHRFVQPPGTPGIELAHHLIRMQRRGDDHMHVIRAHVHCMERPPANATMIANRLCHQLALRWTEEYLFLRQRCVRVAFEHLTRLLNAWLIVLDPSAGIAGQPHSVGGPSDVVSERFGHD